MRHKSLAMRARRLLSVTKILTPASVASSGRRYFWAAVRRRLVLVALLIGWARHLLGARRLI